MRPEALQQDLKHRILLAKLREQGRPGLDEDQSCTALVQLQGPSLGSHAAAVRLATIAKIEEISTRFVRPTRVEPSSPTSGFRSNWLMGVGVASCGFGSLARRR